MMLLTYKKNLPFVPVTLVYQGRRITVPDVLIDTGSVRTIFATDIMAHLHITPMPEDRLYAIRGVGGTEMVFARGIDELRVGERYLSPFEIQVGGMDYGMGIHGILGMDFLRSARATIDLAESHLQFA